MSASANSMGGKRCSPDWPARSPVLPSIDVSATGLRSTVEHSAREQDLDRSQAGKIEPRQGQDRTSGKSNSIKPHSEPLPPREQRAARLQSDAPSTLSSTKPLKAGPSQRPEAVVGGRAGRARKTTSVLGLLCAYSPTSWHDPKGIHKVVRRLLPRLPDVNGMLFHTYTFDHNLFSGPASAFEIGRKKIRKIYARLRKGVRWKGKFYQIDAPYCVKVEFHADEDGWPHFHVIQLTRRYIPGELLTELWGFGRPNVKRITNDEFHYMLKYVTKGIGYPLWVLSRHRLRVFQPSRGFMLPTQATDKPKTTKHAKTLRKRASYTIGVRQKRWARTALFNRHGLCQAILLPQSFQQLFDELVHSVAEDNRYLGLGLIKINQTTDLIPWLLKPNQT